MIPSAEALTRNLYDDGLHAWYVSLESPTRFLNSVVLARSAAVSKLLWLLHKKPSTLPDGEIL